MTTWLLALTLGVLPPAEAPDIGSLAAARLADQFGREDALEAHRGEVVVVMVVDAKRLRKLKGWEQELRGRFDGVTYLRIADVPEEPPVTHEEVAEKLRKRVPEEVSVLIDLERRWAKTLDLDTTHPQVLVFDRDGRLFSSYQGRRNPFLEAYVSKDLERLLGTQ